MNDVMKKHLDLIKSKQTSILEEYIKELMYYQEKFYMNLVRTIDMYYDLNGLTNKTIYLGCVTLDNKAILFLNEYFGHTIKSIHIFMNMTWITFE